MESRRLSLSSVCEMLLMLSSLPKLPFSLSIYTEVTKLQSESGLLKWLAEGHELSKML